MNPLDQNAAYGKMDAISKYPPCMYHVYVAVEGLDIAAQWALFMSTRDLDKAKEHARILTGVVTSTPIVFDTLKEMQ